MSDTKKFRQAFGDAGFRQRYSWLPTVFNDKRKGGIRRLKLWDGSHVFHAPQFAQVELERQLKKQYGPRYMFGEFIRANERIGGKSFIVYLTD
jgi:hypothetical protein